jgi:hypothetical protein
VVIPVRTSGSFAVSCAVALALAACGGSSDSAEVSSTTSLTVVTDSVTPASKPSSVDSAPTSTRAPIGSVYPLTGRAVDDPQAPDRPALVVKIDNHPKARPQTGLGVADIVFEENVEGLTRFAAVFHSEGSDPVGPIRSGRAQDVDILGSLAQPLFAWSGGNAGVTRLINDSDLVSLSNLDVATQTAGGFYRDDDRDGPHDLYAQSSMLWTLAPAGAAPPPQQFAYRGPVESASGEATSGVDLSMDGVTVGWDWDAGSGRFLRSQDGEPHGDAVSGRLGADNVVVMVVDYRASVIDSSTADAVTVGTGELLVFTEGKLVRGTWSRDDRLSTFTLTAADGSPIKLTPGTTWVELARPGVTTAR